MFVAAILAALGMIGFLVAASGLIPIRASSGHWGITRWFLQFSKARSISTHALGIDVPPLEDPALVLRGAAAYDLACRTCHGSPDLPHPRVAQAMLPRPPYLPEVLHQWSPAELFEIVKHGLKFTGMPAWPAQNRDDEVWAIVAFLLEMPKLDAERYRRLVRRESGSVPACSRCHEAGGGSGFPRLAGQRRTYLENALKAFASGRRHSGIMETVAIELTPAQIQEAARYFSSLAPRRVVNGRGATEQGMAIALKGIPARKVPPCAECHGPAPVKKNDAYPILDGQFADYLMLQLHLFKSGRRGGSRYAHLMQPVAAALHPDEIRAVALYYESRPLASVPYSTP